MASVQSNFEFISSYCEPRFSVEKYQSNRTGMKLYHVNVPLPSIKLEICVQTRPYDDTGCPHTLGEGFDEESFDPDDFDAFRTSDLHG